MPDETADPLAPARAALARGDLVSTYDLAVGALDEGVPGADYLVVLSLARLGDTAAARARYLAFGLDAATDVDTRALWARLAKDEAAAAQTGPGRTASFREASAAYARIFEETGDVFPGVNAATTALLSGDVEGATRCAADILTRIGESADFWTAASRAEALLLLGREDDALAGMRAALALPGASTGARTTTLRQLDLIARGTGLDAGGAIRDVLRPPTTLCYCGHMFLADPAAEATLAARIDAVLEERQVGIGFGALACGSDILVAERLLARGCELNVVLPFRIEDFRALSVEPGGSEWNARFDACLAAAASLHIVSSIGDIGDPQALRHASDVGMGLARLRARHHATDATLLAIWDGTPPRGVAGTALDVAAWEAAHGETVVLAPEGIDRRLTSGALPTEYDGPPRVVMALIFADVPGFAALPEIELPTFWREVMGTVGQVLDRHGQAVVSRNSWGDAIFAVVDKVSVAAEIVLSLQETLKEITPGVTLRIGVHQGTVFATPDPITHLPTFYGRDVARAARIEPVTPPGQVYVTESFAAALAMEAEDEFRCFYVGQVQLAKQFGTFPMYRLARAGI